MNIVVATTVLVPKTLSNLPERLAFRIGRALGTNFETHYNDNVVAHQGHFEDRADQKFIVPNDVISNGHLKPRSLCAYDNALYMLLADNLTSPKTIHVYDITQESIGELIQKEGSTFFINDNTTLSREAFQQQLEQYTHESLPRQVTIGPITLYTTRKHNLLPKNGKREKRRDKIQAQDKASLEQTIQWIIREQQKIQKQGTQHAINNPDYI